MAITLFIDGTVYLLGAPDEVVVDAGFARMRLASLLQRSDGVPELRRLLGVYGGGAGPTRLSDQEVVDRVADLVSRGQLVLASSGEDMFQGAPAGAGMEREQQEPEEQAPPQDLSWDSALADIGAAGGTQSALHWLGIEVVDDATGEPLAGIPFKLRMPDGRVRELTSDAEGRVHVKNLPAGHFDIQAINDSDALEVVAVE